MINLKNNFRRKKLSFGSWITFCDGSVVEIMAKSGFDWLAIDMEHSPLSFQDVQNSVRIIELCGVVPLVRIEQNDQNIIKRVMDTGAHGVIVPMVNTKGDAEKAVNAVKYPPKGFRGVGLSRANGYGSNFSGYKKWLENNSIVVVQIEHIQAVENLSEILKVKGVDAFIVGPYDLSGSMGIPGDFDHPDMKKAMKEIKMVGDCLRVPLGYHVVHPSVKSLKEKIKEGYTFLAYGTDFLFLGEMCRKELALIKKFR